MRFCTKCCMPDTRPGIRFDKNGVCIACRNNENKKNIDWSARRTELEKLCDKYRRKRPEDFDCIIAVSGGKDSHYQVHLMKEEMGMNPLLVTAEDFFTQTEASKHNNRNISEAFGCSLISFHFDLAAAKKLCKYMFVEYGRPTWVLDRMLYRVPLYFAVKFRIPLVVYGENVSYEYGGVDDEETYSAREQIFNGVAPEFDLTELSRKLDIPMESLGILGAFTREELDFLDPIYLSYFVEWNAIKNYEFAKTRGFRSLEHEWDRTNQIENFNQIDSYGGTLNSWMKYPKFGHAYATDYASRWVRYGVLTREEAVKLIEEKDHAVDSKIIQDFCRFTGMSIKEFYDALENHYNKDLFEKNMMGQWRLKREFYENRRNPKLCWK